MMVTCESCGKELLEIHAVAGRVDGEPGYYFCNRCAACPCTTDVEDPGPHVPECPHADLNFVNPNFMKGGVAALAWSQVEKAMDEGATLDEACASVAKTLPDPDKN